MGVSGKKGEEKTGEKQQEMKVYIRGAGRRDRPFGKGRPGGFTAGGTDADGGPDR